jgi:hypothetical protein
VKPKNWNSVKNKDVGPSATNALLISKLNVVVRKGSSNKMKRFVADHQSH